MVIPSSFEGIIEGVSKKDSKIETFDYSISMQASSYFHSICNLFPYDFRKTFNNVSNVFPILFLNNH